MTRRTKIAKKPICTVEGCDAVAKTNGSLCQKHYMRWWRHGHTDIVKRGPKINIKKRNRRWAAAAA
jgi:hypothetical protein